MNSDPGTEPLTSEAAFRDLLKGELSAIREALAALRSRWDAFSRQPGIPDLPLPFPELDRPGPPLLPAPEGALAEIDILSLDVFDTSLWRVSGEPESVFRMLERRMAIEGSAVAGFARLRVEVENRLRREFQESGLKEDVSLKDIYDRLARDLGWSPGRRDYWFGVECALERDLLLPHPAIRELAMRASRAGLPVIFVTEMYLPPATLVDLLKAAGFEASLERLFSSGELGLSKGSGNLYRHVLEQFPGKRIGHIGDNPETDTAIPGRLGLRTQAIPKLRPRHDDDLSNVLEAASTQPAEGEPFWQRLGRRVVGPLATAWVLDIIREAGRRELRQLAFLTRDGYFPRIVFDRLAPLLNCRIESLTCFSSRRMLGLAAMETITADDWDFLLKPAPGFRVRDFLDRVELPEAAYRPVCEAHGIDPDERVCHHRGFHDPATKDRLYRLFLEMMDAVYAVRDGLRERVPAYLRTRLPEPGRAGIVDIGWNGSSFQSLERLLGDGIPGAGFYLALWGDRQARGTGAGRLASYFIRGPQAAAEERLLRGGVALLEFLLGSPFGTVIDLRRTGDGWEPVHAEPDVVGAYERAAYAGIETGLATFLDRFIGFHGHLADGDGKSFLRERLQRLIYLPSADERDHLGRVSHVEGWGSSRRWRLLPDMRHLTDDRSRALAYAYSGWKAAWRH